MERRHCGGCRNNFYNGNNPLGVSQCWSLKDAKLVWRIPIGHWENPPYKGKRKRKVPNCWHGEGPNRTHYVDPSVLTPSGYWKS